jgi:phage recombination protein Bet
MEFTEDKLQLLKNTVCKGSSDAELQLFTHICNRTGLDPFAKQIYAIKRGDTMTIQTSIDGYRLIAERTRGYAPGRQPDFVMSDGKLISATAYIRKQTDDGTWHEVAATAFFDEYVQRDRTGAPMQFWKKMPHTMLAKCAEALALRKAFPADFSGIYTREEMAQAENVEEASVIDLEGYLQTWGDEKEQFQKFMESIMTSYKWNETKTLQQLMKDPVYTKSSFEKWMQKQITQVA